jgi:hypothetical protein
MTENTILLERGDEEPWSKDYLGDGVYASFDGWHMWLRTSDGLRVTNEIALEPAVYSALVRYATRLQDCCEFAPGDRVRYIPGHAFGDLDHEDCEDGTVSSQNGTCVFVRFDAQVEKLGWLETTAQGCDPRDLAKL